MKKRLILLAGLCWLTGSPAAQNNDGDVSPPFSVNEGTMIGLGGYHIGNSYLSPSTDPTTSYTGTGLRVINERMKLLNPHLSSQQILHVDFSLTRNPAITISAISGIIDYTYTFHFRYYPSERLKLLAGPSLRGMFGFIYNTQAANNPTALNADIDLNLSVGALYTLWLRNWPLTFRCQADAPFAGVLFAPDFGQSYYEIFGLGNMTDVVRFGSLHNKQALRSYLTVDLPVAGFTVRTGYVNNLYYTDINNIKTHHVSHSFMIGLVKEFVSFSGKRLKKRHLYQSAYY
ncbi:MAG: DUF3316 domain-containing protein [Tannerella sp.]|jgi:hypothetical protein|nr:DUF3316 domain-containing protein [Tannerella sp.]